MNGTDLIFDVCLDYLTGNYLEIAENVNICFVESVDYIRTRIIREIRRYLTPLPVHYRLENGNYGYDHSGILIADGTITTGQTISEFLGREYSGNRKATYTSGCGYHYNTYGDELSQFTLQLGYIIMSASVHRQLYSVFSVDVPDDAMDDLLDCYGDDIYDNCMASDFFFYETPIEFTGVGKIPLYSLLKK